MNPQQAAIIVQRGHHDAYEILVREFGSKGVRVFWDRRMEERRRQTAQIADERRARQRRQDETWNILHFRVVSLKEPLVAFDTIKADAGV